MAEFTLNIPTIIILIVIAGLMVLAVRRMTKKGLCDCDEKCGENGNCAGCGAVDKMVADMEKAAQKG